MAIRTVHSSVEGTNFDFILEVKDPIVLTNLGIFFQWLRLIYFIFDLRKVVGGNFNGFTSYLKDAYVFEVLIVI